MNRKLTLSAQMLICNYTVKELLNKIAALETDTQSSVSDKISEMKKIQDEIMKVGDEIDRIKKEIKLLDSHKIVN